MNNFYKDKVIIVTGASSGIGLASATRFASLGAKVVLASRSIDKLEKIAEEIRQQSTDKGQQSTDNGRQSRLVQASESQTCLNSHSECSRVSVTKSLTVNSESV